ncbi:hypothetical protein [Shewanella halifaxensis]|uniref:hypothetical protein n=1 Tax=Shewanella halifaxensis TaxID=271098 RepID=UPI00031FE71B|nr:hypothetical protein [Shewanella halifaxensis]
MTLWMRVTILVGLISAAIACYLAGMAKGATGLLVLGVLLELAFWVGLIKQNSRS